MWICIGSKQHSLEFWNEEYHMAYWKHVNYRIQANNYFNEKFDHCSIEICVIRYRNDRNGLQGNTVRQNCCIGRNIWNLGWTNWLLLISLGQYHPDCHKNWLQNLQTTKQLWVRSVKWMPSLHSLHDFWKKYICVQIKNLTKITSWGTSYYEENIDD